VGLSSPPGSMTRPRRGWPSASSELCGQSGDDTPARNWPTRCCSPMTDRSRWRLDQERIRSRAPLEAERRLLNHL
jgi:hypothetical protein